MSDPSCTDPYPGFVHPDTLGGRELDQLVDMFRDVDITDPAAIEARANELRQLNDD